VLGLPAALVVLVRVVAHVFEPIKGEKAVLPKVEVKEEDDVEADVV
jgi:hypothetical protein